MKNTFDIIVIGAGSGGLNVASFMNTIGCSVLLIDKSDAHIGGDCLNYGCVPSKALIHAARTVHTGTQTDKFGVTTSGAVDIYAVMRYVKEKQNIIREHENAEHFRSIGMTVVLGAAEFESPNSIRVGDTVYHGKKIILATGSRPRTLSVPGIESARVYTNETIFDITELPKHLVCIGGGPISLELGQAFAYLGSKVTIIHSGKTLLEKEISTVGEHMLNTFQKEGIIVLLQSRPVEVHGGMIRVATIDSAGTESMQDVPFDAIFSGIGRVLNIDNLSLEKAGIQTNTEKTRLIVDDYLRTTNHRVYAVGDVAGRHMFTHAAEMHARVVISNILSPFKKKVSGSMAWVTYTNPEVGTFGSSAEVLTRTRVAFSETTAPVTSEDRGIVDDAQGFLTLYTGAKNVILGGTLVAPHAGEMIGELILATEHKMTTGDLFARVAPYPTLARIIRRVSSKQESKKLTPLAKRILRVLCRLL